MCYVYPAFTPSSVCILTNFVYLALSLLPNAGTLKVDNMSLRLSNNVDKLNVL